MNVKQLGIDLIKEQQKVAFELSLFVFLIQPSLLQAMQLCQYSSLLEIKAQELGWDALCLQTAALCRVATTNFLDLMENFYGVDETSEEQALGVPAFFSAFVAAHKKEKERDEASKSLSKSKQEIEAEEIDAGEDDDESDEESKTLKQKKKPTAKYPSKCSLAEAQLFFPTLDKTVHETGVDSKLIGSRENLRQYRRLYCCLFKGCDYGAQTRGNTLSHIHRVHLRHALGCCFCPEKSWWQARYWIKHMHQEHRDLPKYETIAIPAVKIEPEVFVSEEDFEVPIPKQLEDKTPEPPTQKPKGDILSMMSYDEFVEASKEGSICTAAYRKDPLQPRPKVAAIRYRHSAIKEEESDIVNIGSEVEDTFLNGISLFFTRTLFCRV